MALLLIGKLRIQLYDLQINTHKPFIFDICILYIKHINNIKYKYINEYINLY